MRYVIYLSTSQLEADDYKNTYGYYAGTYQMSGDAFPIWDRAVTSRTKKYKSKSRAESMAKTLLDRCAYVLSWRVEQVE
ncbi:hypothetical protein CHH67_21295 [Paenibacillus campinasensis]|uniref:Uncharacterized protein n=1 Tax=Paenibacillus campinasensis TaxID=66347 RepID=A0A268EIA2_9BACL|nr:hypothetical protein CHH67_21295 [Paenibacillus campinasensis]